MKIYAVGAATGSGAGAGEEAGAALALRLVDPLFALARLALASAYAFAAAFTCLTHG
jgi:hypothetical protein